MSNNARAATAAKNEGNEFFKRKEYDDAIAKYSEAVGLCQDEESKKSIHIYYSNRSAAYLGAGKFREAAADGRACIAANPTFLKGYHRAGGAMLQTGEYKDGVALLEKGLVHHAGNPDLLKLLSELKAKHEEAEKARMSGMSREELLKEEANQLFKAARFEDAIIAYGRAVAAISDTKSKLYLTCLNNRAACNQQLSNFSAVIEDTSFVLEHEPNNVKALIRRGLAFEGLERYRSALADIRQVLSIDPSIDIANKAQHRIGGAVRRLKAESRAI